MAEVTSGVTDQQVRDLIYALSATAFVGASNITPLPLADLFAQFPAGEDTVGKYARVSNLFGSVDDIMRCRYDGQFYRWVPQRTDYSGNNVVTSGTVTLMPLVTTPTVRLTGTLTGNIIVQPNSTNAYVGQRFRVIAAGTLGIYTMTITGLLGSNLSLLGGGSREVEYSGTGWFQSN